MNDTFWLFGVCLFPLILGFALMWLPPRLWQRLLPRLDQPDVAMCALATGLTMSGLALVILYGQSIWEGWRSKHWQAVPGVMLEARIAETRSPRSTNPYWEPRLSYRYTVNGTAYEGSRLSYDQEKTVDRDALQARLTREWLPGTAVTVWVDSGNPGKAVLKQGASGWLVVFVGTGLVLLAVGVHLLRLAVQGLRSNTMPRAPRHNPRRSTTRAGSSVPMVANKRRKRRKP